MQRDDILIWTEAFNCAEILPPFLKSFRKHHANEIFVATTKREFDNLPSLPGVRFLPVQNSLVSKTNRTDLKAIKKGFNSGHLGTARLWANIIQNRREKYLIHLDADTVFLDEVISHIINGLDSGFDFVGTRRPYLHRGYRITGTDSIRLDRHPDAINTDIIGFRRKSIPTRNSPFLTRWIRGKRPLRYPVVDYFDPVLFKALRRQSKVLYIDSPDRGPQSVPNPNSHVLQSRISFAAVGSGLNFLKHPDIQTSPGYRAYAISSFALFSKYLLDYEIGAETLENPDLEAKLKRLNKDTWRLSQ